MDTDTTRYTSPMHRAARLVAQRGLMKPYVWSLADIRVKGKENVEDLKPPFIVVANHSSHLDAPLIMCSLPYRIAKDLSAGAAADYFFDVWWRRGFTTLMFNAFPVNRKPGRKGAGMAMRLLREGVPLLVFPEGTRSRTGKMASFTTGASGLSQTTGVPILPIALAGAHDAMPVGKMIPRPGRPPVTVVIGKPMHAGIDEPLKAFTKHVENEIRSMLRAEGYDDDAVIDTSGIEAAMGVETQEMTEAERAHQALVQSQGDDHAPSFGEMTPAPAPEASPADKEDQQDA